MVAGSALVQWLNYQQHGSFCNGYGRTQVPLDQEKWLVDGTPRRVVADGGNAAFAVAAHGPDAHGRLAEGDSPPQYVSPRQLSNVPPRKQLDPGCTVPRAALAQAAGGLVAASQGRARVAA
jgi:hypothetical protein